MREEIKSRKREIKLYGRTATIKLASDSRELRQYFSFDFMTPEQYDVSLKITNLLLFRLFSALLPSQIEIVFTR